MRVFISLLMVVAQLGVFVSQTSALSQSGVVIAQMYPGATGVASQEFIELYNNSTNDVNVTNWCMSYISSTGATTTKLGCLTAPDGQTSLWVKAGGYITFVSNEYKVTYPGTVADVYFASGISATAGHVKLTDAAGNEVDRLGWGTAINPEVSTMAAPANGESLRRIAVGNSLQDSDNNNADFVQSLPMLHASNVYEVVSIVDLCPNVPDAQVTIPTGYALDEAGNCEPDSCLNMAGLQVSVPDGYDSDSAGNCTQHDECDNVGGIQSTIPDNMVRSGDNDCRWDVQPLVITEILPDALGSDTGGEFIEVYNPTDRIVNLSLYNVAVGLNGEKTYAFPVGAMVAPGEYRAFTNAAMKFTLVNTVSRVTLNAIDGSTLSDTGTYDSPAEGESWALIDGIWQYTNQVTPDAANMASVVSDTTITTTHSSTNACPAGKYRNPLTNRCRNIATDAAVLAACEADQYRNPDTGRCKKISTSILTPCNDNQYRSEETNRCRNIVAASAQKPCKDNQYRSEQTNRCRNLPVTAVPDAAFAVQPVKDTGMAFVGWWALGGVSLLALGYAGWEWRGELLTAWSRFAERFGGR